MRSCLPRFFRSQCARLTWRAPSFLAASATIGALAATATFAGCSDCSHQIVISVPEQRMAVLKDGQPVAVYPVSTSRFGLGDAPGTCATPLGDLAVAEKIGGGAPLGMKFKNRVPTGEIVPVDAPGRDPVVTRILWLRGLQTSNQNAHDRYIYIHGTPEEYRIGHPASYGCVRMRSRDVAALYDEVGRGAGVRIADSSLTNAAAPFLAAGANLPPALPATTRQPPSTALPLATSEPGPVTAR